MKSVWALLAVAILFCGSGSAVAQPGGPSPLAIEDWQYDGRRVLGTARDTRIDNIAYLWDATTGRIIQRYEHKSTILAATMLVDGLYVATSSSHSPQYQGGEVNIRVWNVGSARLVGVIPEYAERLHSGVNRTQVLNVTREYATVWDAVSGKDVFVFSHAPRYAFSPDRSKVAVLNRRRAVIWDMEKYVEVFSLQSPGESTVFRDVQICENFLRMLVVDHDQSTRVVSTADGTEILQLPPPENAIARSHLTSDGLRLVQHYSDGSLTVREIDSGSLRSMQVGNSIAQMTFTPDGRFLVKHARQRERRPLEIWDLDSGVRTVNITFNDPRNSGRFSGLHFVGTAPDGLKMLLVATEEVRTSLTAFQISLVNGRILSESKLEVDPEPERASLLHGVWSRN